MPRWVLEDQHDHRGAHITPDRIRNRQFGHLEKPNHAAPASCRRSRFFSGDRTRRQRSARFLAISAGWEGVPGDSGFQNLCDPLAALFGRGQEGQAKRAARAGQPER